MDLRCELIDGTFVINSSMHGCTEEGPGRAGYHSVIGEACIGDTLEAVDNALLPYSAHTSHLEDDTATASCAAFTRGAVHIAGRVGDQVADGTVAVTSAFEAVENSFFRYAVGTRRQLVNAAKVICPVVVSGAVEITGSVEIQSAVRKSCVGLALESVNRFELESPILIESEFEGRALTINATRGGHAVEIARAIQKQPTSRA